MKIARLLSALLVAAALLAIIPTALAAQTVPVEGEAMTLQLPDDFTVVQRSTVSALEPELQGYTTTVTETELKFTNGHYLLLAISPSMHCTLFLTREETPLSRGVGDLIACTDHNAASRLLLGDHPENFAEVREIERAGALFYRVDCGVSGGVGRLAYLTVMNGVSYTLCVADNTGEMTDNLNAMFDRVFQTWDFTVTAETLRIQRFHRRVVRTVAIICIPLLLAAAGFLLRGLVRDIRARREEQRRRDLVPRRPRR